jgi:phage/plasmid-associated DNA primase
MVHVARSDAINSVQPRYARYANSIPNKPAASAEAAAAAAATKAWHQESDHLTRFVSRELIISPGCKIPASKLYDLYSKWCAKNGEHALSVQSFKEKLQESHDITHARVKGRSWWRGIQLHG